jgi:pilus assembly protein CpaF
MRPDRLVVGEVRGAEVTDLLSALNTGHEGGCGTVHANAAVDVPARLEALGSTAGLDRAALHSQLAAALSVVVHLVRDASGRRRLAEIHVLRRGSDGLVATVPALIRDPLGHTERGPGWQRLTALCSAGAS